MTFKYRYRKQILIGVVTIFILSITSIGIYKFYSAKPRKEEKEVLVTKKSEKTSENKKNVSKEELKEIMVDIKGYVNQPGIYKLKEDSRVIDAINMAGGVTNMADTSVLNLSKKLKDEMVIIVYSYEQVANFKLIKEEESIVEEQCKVGINDIENDACIEQKQEEVNSNTKVSINTGTLEELMTLEGIGEAKAKSIIEYRETNGNFEKIEDILNVSGIGESLFDKIKENITL